MGRPVPLPPLDWSAIPMRDSSRLSTGTLKRTRTTWYRSGLNDDELFERWMRGDDGLTYGEWLQRPMGEVRPPDSGDVIGPFGSVRPAVELLDIGEVVENRIRSEILGVQLSSVHFQHSGAHFAHVNNVVRLEVPQELPTL